MFERKLRPRTELVFGDRPYRVSPHPRIPSMAYAQEGGAGTVYRVEDADGAYLALKVFHPSHRAPALVQTAEALRPWSAIPGLEVCDFRVLHTRNHRALLLEHPQLTYAILMPWIEGPAWQEILLDEQAALSAEQSLQIAAALAETLAALEQQGVAHCDLSGGNLLLPLFREGHSGHPIALVDVEQMYCPGRLRPDPCGAGTQGYRHLLSSAVTYWSAKADRFAGAVLLAEILGWCDPEVRSAKAGETFFGADLPQNDPGRMELLRKSLARQWGAGVADLLARAFDSERLDDCPVFDEWQLSLSRPATSARRVPALEVVDRLRMLEQRGQFREALEYGRSLQGSSGLSEGLRLELPMILEDLERAVQGGSPSGEAGKAPVPAQRWSPAAPGAPAAPEESASDSVATPEDAAWESAVPAGAVVPTDDWEPHAGAGATGDAQDAWATAPPGPRPDPWMSEPTPPAPDPWADFPSGPEAPDPPLSPPGPQAMPETVAGAVPEPVATAEEEAREDVAAGRSTLTLDGVLWTFASPRTAEGDLRGHEGSTAVVHQLAPVHGTWTGPALVVRDDGQPPFQVPCDGSPVRVGRASWEIPGFEQPAVSREHGAFVLNKGHLFFWDNNSRNGTWVGGEPIAPERWVPVPPGSLVRLGGVQGAALWVRAQPDTSRALKVFREGWRRERTLQHSERLAPFSSLAGLRVARRRVLTPERDGHLLAAQPQLEYSVMMPWIAGPTWRSLVRERTPLAPAAVLEQARSLARILARMEDHRIAHCQLSGSHVALVGERGSCELELLDLEAVYGPGFPPPESLPRPPAYQHPNRAGTEWGPAADRFSGALLIAEMLAWCDPTVTAAAAEEGVFEPADFQKDGVRFGTVRDSLAARWGALVTELFERAWRSESPEACPTLAEWTVALPERVPTRVTPW